MRIRAFPLFSIPFFTNFHRYGPFLKLHYFKGLDNAGTFPVDKAGHRAHVKNTKLV